MHPRDRATRWVKSGLAAAPVALRPSRSDARSDARPDARPEPPQLDLQPPPDAAALADAAELWLALHLPALCLEAVRPLQQPAQAAAAEPPWAVLDAGSGRQRLIAVDAVARRHSVEAGMSLSSALAICPSLQARVRDPRCERLRLVALAEASLGVTPRVSLEPPDAVLLEVRGSLKLFGGVDALCERLQFAARPLGLTLRMAMAPTPLAALAGARAAAGFLVHHEAQLVSQIAPLPLSALRWPEQTIERLAVMGVRTLGEVLRLPRAGFARRFGRDSLAALDRLVGREREPRRAFVPRQRFRARCDPAYELSNHEVMLRYCQPLLADLEQFLRSRQSAITALRCRLRHRPPLAATRVELRLAAPEFEAVRFAALLAEHLARLPLPGPVRRIELRSGELVSLAPEREGPGAGSGSLWRPGEHGGAVGRETPALLERLRARLGTEAVYGLCLVPEHRPEACWRIAEPTMTLSQRPAAATPAAPAVSASMATTALRRPLWLLQQPEPLPRGLAGLQRLRGPERIESGWWDGHDVARDYYVVGDPQGAELWVFRERQPPQRWFIHGLFG